MILQSLWRGQIKTHTPREQTVSIINEIAGKHRLTAAELQSGTSVRHIAHARQEAFWALHRGRGLSLPVIGRMFNRDHTTVLFGVRAHEARMTEQTNGPR